MQLEAGITNEEESIAWVKILENIIITANERTVEMATRGEFSASLARCLRLLLRTVTISGKRGLHQGSPSFNIPTQECLAL